MLFGSELMVVMFLYFVRSDRLSEVVIKLWVVIICDMGVFFCEWV